MTLTKRWSVLVTEEPLSGRLVPMPKFPDSSDFTPAGCITPVACMLAIVACPTPARPGETVDSCGCVFWGSHPGASLPIRVRSCSGCAQLSECMHVLSREGQSLCLMCSARCAPLGGAVHVLN
jgi:hypothetical protein